MDLRLKDRVALVTGSSRGIGKATAELLACEGAKVAITYYRLQEQAERLVGTIVQRGGDAIAVKLDLASAASIESALDAVAARWHRLDILVNNALVTDGAFGAHVAPFGRLGPEQWQRLLRGNIEGTYATIQRALPLMRQGHWGRIVTVSSTAVADGAPGLAWYAVIKAAQHGLSRTLAKELAADGVLVNIVMPGPTETRMMEEVSAEARHFLARMSLLKRLMKPEEVASTIVFLASGANTAITGEVIRVSGGSAV